MRTPMAPILRGAASRNQPRHRCSVEVARLDPEIGEHIDQHLFDPIDVGGRVGHAATPLPGHGENRVAHELTRP